MSAIARPMAQLIAYGTATIAIKLRVALPVMAITLSPIE